MNLNESENNYENIDYVTLVNKKIKNTNSRRVNLYLNRKLIIKRNLHTCILNFNKTNEYEQIFKGIDENKEIAINKAYKKLYLAIFNI